MHSPTRVFAKNIFSKAAEFSGDNTVFIVPSSSGRRRVAIEALNQSSGAILTPRSAGIGEIPRLLLSSPEQELASVGSQLVAWTNSLIANGSHSFLSLYKLSKLIQRDYADIMMWGYQPSTFPESHKLILECFDGYQKNLSAQNLLDPYSYFQEKNFNVTQDLHIVLVGVLELPALSKELLLESKVRVTSVIGDFEQSSDLYDELGCVSLKSQVNGLSSEQIKSFESVTDSHDYLISYLSKTDKKYLICNLDEPDSSLLRYRLATFGVDLRPAEGESYKNIDLLRFLSSLAGFVENKTYRDYSRLARFFDVDLSVVDSYFEEHRPYLVTEPEPEIAKLAASLKKVASLDDHISSISSLDEQLDQFDQEVVGALFETLEELKGLKVETELSFVEFVDLLVEELSQKRRPCPVRPKQVDLVGWLELRSYEVDEVIVVGGTQLASDNESLIKDSTREKLGMFCDKSRLLRDISICRTLQSKLKFFVSRRNSKGELVSLSQMLLAGDREFRLKVLSASATKTSFKRESVELTLPVPQEKVERMRVTSFSSFWRSPYAFYLERVLGLRETGSTDIELSAAQLGNILHSLAEKLDCEEDLVANLESLYEAKFSEGDSKAVALQFMMLRDRLPELVRWHLERKKEGWRVSDTEFLVEDKLCGVKVVGRVDRLDKKGSQFNIVDYKFLAASDYYFKRNYDLPLDEEVCPDFQAALYMHFFRNKLKLNDILFTYVVISDSGIKEVNGPTWEYVDAVLPIAKEIVGRASSGDFSDDADYLSSKFLAGRAIP